MKKILLIIKTPPPITGATLMNQKVYNSKLLKVSFNIRSINIRYVRNLNEFGKWNFAKVFIAFKVLVKLLYEIWFHRPNLIYFQISPHGFAFLRDFIFSLIMKVHRVKIVFHLHGKGIKEKSNFKKIFYRFCLNHSYVICLSPMLAYDIEDVYNGRIFFVPNGISYVDRESYKKINHKLVRLLFLSNLTISKGILDYIQALRILKEKHIDFQGIIIGAEFDLKKNELYKIIKENGLDSKVEYLGPKYDEEKNKILENVDMLIFPTKNDIWGNVILEAMQYELPVIATYEGAIPEIIDDGVNGFIVEKNSPYQIADKIEFLVKNPEKRIEMGKAGRKKFLEKYTIEKFEQNMKYVFDEILNKEG